MVEKAGIDKKNMLRSVIILVVGLVVVLTLLAFVLGVKFCFWNKLHPKIRAAFTWCQSKLMFSSIFRAILISYLSTAISACYGLQAGLSNGTTNFLVSLTTMVCLIAFPAFSQLFLAKRQEKVADKAFKLKYGTLYSGVEVYGKPESLSFTTLFCVRRLMFAFTVVFIHAFLVG